MTESDIETEIRILKREAEQRWGERWTVRVQRYADGDASAFAFRSHGLDENGHLVMDRLSLLDSGETVVERTTTDRREVDVETIEAPTAID